MTDDNLDNIIPYATLKASLDEATAEMEAKEALLIDSIHRQEPPLLMAIALHNFTAAYAKALARSNAVMREYGHLAEVTQNIQNQRDETKRKYESLKKTVNQLKKLNLDDEDGGSPGGKPNTKNDTGKPNDQNDPNDPSNPPNKGRKRKK